MTEVLRLRFAPLRMTSNVVKFVTSFGILLAVSAPAVAADPGLDVSHIIDQAMAESVLNGKVKEAVPRNVQGGDGHYSKCNYYSVPPGKTLLLRVYQAAEGYDPEQEFETVTKNTPATKSVSGVGDKAIVTTGTASGLPQRVLMLYTIQKKALVTVGLSGLVDEDAALEKAKSVAQKILAQL